MLELLLPEASEPATAAVETTLELHPGAGESQAARDRSHHRGHPLGEGQEILELLVGAAPSAWRGGSGGSDKEKVKESLVELDSPDLVQEEENFMEEHQEFSPELDDKKESMSPRRESPGKIKLEEKKFPSPPQSPLRFLLQPAMNMLARLTKGETDPFGGIKPLDNKSFRRADLPKVPRGGWGRGNRNRALAAMAKKSKGRRCLEEDFQAKSSRAPKESRRRTVRELLRMDPAAEGFKLNVESLQNLAAALKEARYKSAVIYLTEAKLVHVERGWEWSAQLDRYFKLCKASLSRAKGPSKKAPEVPEFVRKIPPPKDVSWRTKVVFAYELFLLATVWMLREIEVSSLTTNSFLLDHMGKKVTIDLLVSKSDQDAVGVKRTLQCVCASAKCEWDCPFRVTLDVVCKVEKFNGTGSQLCIRRDRKAVTKYSLVSAWCTVFQMKVGGHSGRRSGALHYVRLGWTLPQIAFLGRWKSNIVVEYAQEALELAPVNDKESKHRTSPSQTTKGTEVWEQIEACQKNLKKEVKWVKEELSKSKDAVEVMAKKFEEVSEKNGGHLPPWVRSGSSKTTHRNGSFISTSPPFTWRTVCGWYYASSNFTFTDVEGDNLCLKCKAAQEQRGS